MNFEKTKRYLYKTMLMILCIMVLIVTICSIFKIYGKIEKQNPVILIIGSSGCILFFFSIKKYVNKINSKYSNIIAIGICLLFFIVLSVVGTNMLSIPKTDLNHIIQEVETMLQNGGKFENEVYFAMYPNQTPLTILIFYICRFGKYLGFNNIKAFATVFNALFITITAFFTYLTVKQMKDYKYGLLTLLFFVLNPIFYLYVSYFYTDTICLPFTAIAIFLYVISTKIESNKKSFILLIISGAVFALGYKIRVIVAISFIGIIASFIINNKINKKILTKMGILFVGFIVGILIYKLIEMPFNVIQNKEYEFPMTHWVMMGLNVKKSGGWSSKDYNYTKKIIGYENKKEANINKIKNRVSKMNLKKFVLLINCKIWKNWSNGDYEYLPKMENVEKITDIYEYISGNKKIFTVYLCQIFKISIMTVLLISILNRIKSDKYNKDEFVFISILGAFLFYLVWEVRQRYSLSFLPLIMLTFPIGIETLDKLTIMKKVNIKNIVFNLEIIKKIMIIGIAIVSIIILTVTFYEFTIKMNSYSDKVISQTVKNNKKEITSKNVITQTFSTDKKFNKVNIKFIKNKEENSHYKFVLFDSQMNEIYTEDFLNKDIENNKFKEFAFENVVPNNRKQYTIQISSNDASIDSSISVATSETKNYDVYKDGVLKINNENTIGDIVFTVEQENTRPLINIKNYLLLALIIILFNMFIIYSLLIKNNE